ncbi:MAG: hypothetical protein P1U83_18415 [Roseovarius sp.]|nr:hypothetical protein [Roseovarius sp.]
MNSLRSNFAWKQSSGIPVIDGAVVLLWNGFEARSTKVLRSADLTSAEKVYCFCFDDNQFDLAENDQVINKAVPEHLLERIRINRQKQFLTYQVIHRLLSTPQENTKVIFDITCFPRDVLLIILYACWQVGKMDDLICVYNLASDYSVEADDLQQKWLSKGVANVSPVIGYRGVVRPERKLQLIGLVGFDDQRILQIADILSPSSFVFAHGDTKIRDREWLISQSKDAVSTLMAQLNESSEDSFVCEDGSSVYAVIDRAREAKPDLNQVIVPMNNKISTLFAGTYCLINRSVQVCYGGALIYNHTNYSTESDIFFAWSSSGP